MVGRSFAGATLITIVLSVTPLSNSVPSCRSKPASMILTVNVAVPDLKATGW